MTDRLYAELSALIESSLSSETVLDRLLDLRGQVDHLNTKIAQMDRANSEISTELFALRDGGEAKEKCLKILVSEQSRGDVEAAHQNADDALCAFLTALGHGDVVDEYDAIEKWYI